MGIKKKNFKLPSAYCQFNTALPDNVHRHVPFPSASKLKLPVPKAPTLPTLPKSSLLPSAIASNLTRVTFLWKSTKLDQI